MKPEKLFDVIDQLQTFAECYQALADCYADLGDENSDTWFWLEPQPDSVFIGEFEATLRYAVTLEKEGMKALAKLDKMMPGFRDLVYTNGLSGY